MNRIRVIPLLALLLLLWDAYLWKSLSAFEPTIGTGGFIALSVGYALLSVSTMVALFLYHFARPGFGGRFGRTFLMTFLFTHYLAKSFWLLFALGDDIRRGIVWLIEGALPSHSPLVIGVGLGLAILPVIFVTYGIFVEAHAYRVRAQKLRISGLPAGLRGLRIAQISDVHAGSFWSNRGVRRGIDTLLEQDPDLILFTGDLVNNRADEMEPWIDEFARLEAPLGVFSVFGNHDYGDYVNWSSIESKAANLQRLAEIHGKMGWRLLMDEHVMLEQNNARLAVIGIQNWSAKGRFPKYGDLAQAYAGSETADLKILLSHDPSHWNAQVRPEFPDIDLTLSGHTHGMQFGIEWGPLRWSPVQYVYRQWAGLYTMGDQHLYVNRGFGYLGFPGRVGMPPEITVFELSD